MFDQSAKSTMCPWWVFYVPGTKYFFRFFVFSRCIQTQGKRNHSGVQKTNFSLLQKRQAAWIEFLPF